MGFWDAIGGALKRVGSCVYGGVKKVVQKTVEVAKKVVTATCEGVKKCGAVVKAGWEKFTGRDKEREAEELLAQLETKARTAERDFQYFADEIQNRVNTAFEKLNVMREELNTRDFRRFEALAALFSNWEVAKVRSECGLELKRRHLEPLKTRGDLFKIDFRNHPISSNFKAVFTLGFLTRKRAKETLLAVREEEHRFELDLKKMNAEKIRLENLADSLEQVTKQVSTFQQKYYHKLLDELDYSVNLMRSCYYVQTHEPAPDKIDPEMMPLRHQKCLECADKATRILFVIGNFSFVEMTKTSLTKIDADFNSWQKQQQQLVELQQAFAA
ncbi:MAG: hypothetical protein J5806_08605 [Lentisphaeria bacterium]|nr:hypothetical protein [Lentisphaeria bacterium]